MDMRLISESSKIEQWAGWVGDAMGDKNRTNNFTKEGSSLVHKVGIPEKEKFIKGLKNGVKETLFPDFPLRQFRNQSFKRKLALGLAYVFPIFEWGCDYSFAKFRKDVVAGLTIGSLSVPQDIGYAKLANLPPEYGLYTSFVPPLVYSVLGSSKEIAIGPVAVVSILLGTLLQNSMDIPSSCDTTLSPSKLKPNCQILQNQYISLAFTATFLTGVFQATLGLLRLGFLIDFLSHAAIVGLIAGASITIGLQQLKGLLGIPSSKFTKNTDIVSIMGSVFQHTNMWNLQTIAIGLVFLIFLLIARYIANKKLKFFWIAAMAPLISVILATAFVKLTGVNQHGVSIVNKLPKGINPSSIKRLDFSGQVAPEAAKIAIVVAFIALIEGAVIGRTFATLKNYHIDGNKEMIAFGVMNMIGASTSCYASTGSFSRSAVNYNAGVQTTVSNMVLSAMMLVILTSLTPLFKYTPNCILSAIIINAVLNLIDIKAFIIIWKVDKFDFLACMGAFLGVFFVSVEIGLLVALVISIATVLLQVARPHTALLGNIPGTRIYRNVEQYLDANRVSGILIVRIDAGIYFANANYMRERILRWVDDEEEIINKSKDTHLQYIIIEMSPVTNIDTTGLHSLEELHTILKKRKLQLAIANPGHGVIQKLNDAKFVDTLGHQWIFLTVAEAVQVCSRLLEYHDMA